MSEMMIRVLLVEDNPNDAEMTQLFLSRASGAAFEVDHAGSLAEALGALSKTAYDLTLLDLDLPDSAGLSSVFGVREIAPGMPIVISTAEDDEEVAVEAVRQGAQDFLVKGQFDEKLLARALRYAIERRRTEAEQEILVRELRCTLARTETVWGLLPICASCKKIRDDDGRWQDLESYVRTHSGAEFSHSICPECTERHTPS